MIKTSIIIPVYNTAEYLYDCFNSIYNQTQKNIEVIAVNDGSTDNSLNILYEIKKEHPDMIIYSQENKGLGAARNKGIELATGEYIYFIDSDDCLVSTAMDQCYQYAKKNVLDILMFDAEIFGDKKDKGDVYDRRRKIEDQTSVLTGEEFACRYWLKAYIPSACLIYTSLDFVHRNSLKFVPDIYYEDNEFHCRALPLAERVMYIPNFLYRRRCRDKSITASQFGGKHAKDWLSMIQAIHQIGYNSRMQAIMHKMKLIFLQNLIDKCVDNNIFRQDEFAFSLFITALNICGQDIYCMNTFQDIDILHQISELVSENVVSVEEKQKIADRKKEIVAKLFEDIPLIKSNKFVGIYGTGRNTERFLDEYQENIGDISAKVIFIDSTIRTGQDRFGNYDIYNVDDIGNIPFECIVIASSRYEEEIVRTLTNKYGEKYKLIRLETDLNF